MGRGMSIARLDRPSQAAVIVPIKRMPERQAFADALGQDFQFRPRTRWSICGQEIFGGNRIEILVMPEFVDDIKNVSHGTPLFLLTRVPLENPFCQRIARTNTQKVKY